MIGIQWVKFTWKLKNLPESDESIDQRVEVRSAEKGEGDRVWHTIERAYTMDQGWMTGINARLAEMRKYVMKGLDEKTVHFLVLQDGGRIVGASGLILDDSLPRQLLTGITVVNEYRCRGAGTKLLFHSLKYLEEHGLEEASVVTRANVAAAKFLYPKFGGISQPVEECPKPKDL